MSNENGTPSASDLIGQRVESLAQQVAQTSTTVQAFLTQQQTSQIEQQLGSLQTNAEQAVTAAQAKITAAIESGDAQAQAGAYAELTEAMAKKMRVADQIQQYKERQKNPPPPQKDFSGLEAFKQRNPWYAKDQEMTSAAVAIAKSVESQHGKGTPAYFTAIENAMRERFPDRIGSTPPVAGGGGTGMGGGHVKERVPAAIIDSWLKMGAITDPNDPKQIEEMLSYRKEAVTRVNLPERIPGNLGRILIRS